MGNKIISPSQCRMARAYWNWSQQDLADRSGVSLNTVSKFEKEEGQTATDTIEKLATAISLSGLEVLDGGGVKPAESAVTLLEGTEGFATFMDDVFETMRAEGGIYRVSNVDEANWLRWLGENDSRRRRERTTALKNVSARILVREGDKLLTATDYAEYRAVPDGVFFEGVSGYIYGNKYAIIHFEPEAVRVMVLRDAAFADAQRNWFDAVWETARASGDE